MKARRSNQARASVPFPWSGMLWTFIIAAALFALHDLFRHGVITEEQIMLLTFAAVPIATFLLSGRGQDQFPG